MGYRKDFGTIQLNVLNNTNRQDKADYFYEYVQDGIAEAIKNHNFRDAIQTTSVLSTVSENAVPLMPLTKEGEIIDILSVQMLNNNESYEITLKNKLYLLKRYPFPAWEPQARPEFAYYQNGFIYFNCPIDAAYTVKIWWVEIPDVVYDFVLSNYCPIPNLDTFLIDYATFRVFESIGEYIKASYWRNKALGPKYDDGIVGGSLLRAINYDSHKTAEKMQFEEFGDKSADSVSITYDGKTSSWY